MASVWIKTRVTKSGPRFIVGYRLGGRGAREFHAASCTSSIEAEKIATAIRLQIAGGRLERTATARDELVYFAQLGELIKIGVSVDPERRARSLNAELLHVEDGGRQRERELHDAFAPARVAGEWFRDDVGIRRYIDSRLLPGEDAQAHKELGS